MRIEKSAVVNLLHRHAGTRSLEHFAPGPSEPSLPATAATQKPDRLKNEDCVPKIVLAVKIAQWRQLLPPTLRHPFAKAPIEQGFDRDQHNLWDTNYN
jgi:hypothetical protein